MSQRLADLGNSFYLERLIDDRLDGTIGLSAVDREYLSLGADHEAVGSP